MLGRARDRGARPTPLPTFVRGDFWWVGCKGGWCGFGLVLRGAGWRGERSRRILPFLSFFWGGGVLFIISIVIRGNINLPFYLFRICKNVVKINFSGQLTDELTIFVILSFMCEFSKG